MSSHRGARRATEPTSGGASTQPYSGAGKRSSGRRKALPGRQQASPFAKRTNAVPAIPTLIGATALVIAGAGVIGIGEGAVPDTDLTLSAGANLATAAQAAPRDVDSRIRAISRDSSRQAMQDAADQALQSAAKKQNRQRNAALAQLAKDAEKRAGEIKKNQWVLPVEGYRLTARFGMGGGLWARNHTGLDFAGPIGTPLRAVANGVITETGWDGSYGNKTVLTLTDGTEIWYCHQNSISVNVGDTVVGGQVIGARGTTGNSTGPHLHLEVRPGGGDPVDPFTALIFHGLSL